MSSRTWIGLGGGAWARRSGHVLLWIAAGCAGGSSLAPASSAAQFEYHGAGDWSINGPLGGPYSNTSLLIVLENHGQAPVDWSAAAVPPFLQLDHSAGSIAPNAVNGIHAALNEQFATSLGISQSSAALVFHNESSDQPDVAIACSLSVEAPTGTTVLEPPTGFLASGPAGGPFEPATTSYSLNNSTNANLSWHGVSSDPWVYLTPESGQLAPGAGVEVDLTIAATETITLEPGTHVSHVDFLNDTSSTTMGSREVELDLSPGGPPDGWTVFTPSTDTRKVYVSSSTGNDSNTGLTEAAPKRTIAAGKVLIRSGFPDWLLLKCGDTWDEAIGNWSASGRSVTEPVLITSYGTGDRPFLRTGTGEGIVPGFGTNPNFVSVVGLHFKANLYTGSNGSPKGINWIRHTTGFLLEGCYIERYAGNIVIQGFNETNGNQPPNRHTNVRIRRNIMVEAYNTNSSAGLGSCGLFVANCDGVLIEENVFDHNGWVEGLPGSIPTWHHHNGYVTNGNTGITLRGNIVYGTDGVMMRSGGIVENNVYLRNYNAILFGLGIEPEPAGVTGAVRRNVVLDGRDYGDGGGNPLPGGLCLDMGNVVNTVVADNIFAHNSSGTGPRPIQVHDDHQYDNYRVAENLTFAGNIIYDWGGPALEVVTYDGGHNLQPSNVQLARNIFQNMRDNAPLVLHNVAASLPGVSGANNEFHSDAPDNAWFRVGSTNESLSQWKEQVHDTSSVARRVHFVDPNRTIATYQTSIGATPSLDGFMSQARLQSKANWRAQYTAAAVAAYIRAGFEL